MLFQVCPVKVHVDDAFVGLDDAVLKAGADVQFLFLDAEDERRLQMFGDGYAVELHQRPQGGRDNGAGAGQAHQARNVRGKADGEGAVGQSELVLAAIVVEFLDGGLDEPHAAVVAVQSHVSQKGRDGIKAGQIAVARQNLEMRAFPERHGGAEIANQAGDGLAEVAV